MELEKVGQNLMPTRGSLESSGVIVRIMEKLRTTANYIAKDVTLCMVQAFHRIIDDTGCLLD